MEPSDAVNYHFFRNAKDIFFIQKTVSALKGCQQTFCWWNNLRIGTPKISIENVLKLNSLDFRCKQQIEWQTVKAQIRLLLKDQSDMDLQIFSVNNILFNILNKYKQYNITRV